jgi:hypothetical protein
MLSQPYPLVKEEARAPLPLAADEVHGEILTVDVSEPARDLFVYIIFYDATQKPLGYIVQRHNFDPDYSIYIERDDNGTGPLPVPGHEGAAEG